MFEELNLLAASTQKKKLSAEDPSTWESENWYEIVAKTVGIFTAAKKNSFRPSSSKFCVKQVAMSKMAFENRTNVNLYRVYSAIYGQRELFATIDVWGIMRGTKDLLINGNEREYREIHNTVSKKKQKGSRENDDVI